MEWTVQDIVKSVLGGGLFTGIVALVGRAMGWLRFNKKDNADVSKVKSETAIDLAEVDNKKIDDEVKISKAALEWTVQLAGQLEKANLINEKRQQEIERLHAVMAKMREDFEKRMSEME